MDYRIPAGVEMTPELLAEYIGYHKSEVADRFQALDDAYCNRYPIFAEPKKEPFKPDNRISVNFAKYVTDTMNGFFIGNPITINCESDTEALDQKVNDFMAALKAYNSLDDKNAEISKLSSIFGHAYDYYFVDMAGKIAISPVSPMEGFMIFDDSIEPEPLYFVRYYMDHEGVERGIIADGKTVRSFHMNGLPVFDDEPKVHGFDGVPASEFKENAEKIGIFESALPAINAFNKVLSEKANEVDYFSDSYLVILGADADPEGMQKIKQNRIINFPDGDISQIKVDFLQRPSGDTTQEHLLDRLEAKIYQTCMVTNTSDDAFGTSSGEALKLKLRPMINLARTKERKFAGALARRHRLIFSNPYSGMGADEWIGIKTKFTFDIPNNLSDEATTARNLVGIVSEETILKTLSCVSDVQQEMEQLHDEQ